MVKDLLREIKKKAFQFIALTLITMLGVGFFVGIQVTGYDMRVTGDAYMEERSVLDYMVLHTMGIDEEFVSEVKDLVGGDVVGVYDEDMFARSGTFDSVLKVFAYTDATKVDLTLKDGRFPENENEAVLDEIMLERYGLGIGDEIKLYKNEIFDTANVKIVGLVQSSLFMNLERGQSRLGIGQVSGYIYAKDLPFVLDEPVFTGLRIVDPTVDDVESVLKEHEDTLIANRFDRIIEPEIKKLNDAQKELDASKLKAEREFAKAEKLLQDAKTKLNDAEVELYSGINELAQTELSGSLEERLSIAKSNFDEAMAVQEANLQGLKQMLEVAQTPEEIAQLTEQVMTLEAIITGTKEAFNGGHNQLVKAVEEYRNGQAEYQSNWDSFYSKKENTQRELAQAQRTINKGFDRIKDTDKGKMIIQTRKDVLIGYKEFYDDSNRIEAIGKVFPIIFFGVSILVTLSTITRLIDENRMEVGVYKALGYSSLRASMKFVLFSFLSWFIGSLLGLAFGFYFIPGIIYDAYRIMYATPKLVDGIVVSYAVIPLTISFLSSVGVTFIKTTRITREKTAELLRPLAPKSGQRIFLERITFIWNRLSFLFKVSFRNLFRNKTRFLMTLLGIGGTTGLLIVGFGIKHSIYSIVDKQFGEIIQYDGLVFYDSKDFNTDYFDDMIHLQVDSSKIDGFEVSVYSAEHILDLDEFVSLRNRKTKEPLVIQEDDLIITEKLAKLLNLKVGDNLDFVLNERSVTVAIDHITENYAGHSIYMSQNYYELLTKKVPESNMAFFKTSNTDHNAISEEVLKSDHILSIQFLDEISRSYRDMMKNFDIVIWVVVIAAISLEMLVLSNLISMNMSERQKELATLKVLGFNKGELMTYVLRENIILTVLATLFGFVFGKYLHYFVVTQAEIDAVMFNYELLWTSYFFAFAITMVVSVVLNIILTQRAHKVNMSEALKSFDG